MAYDFDGPAAIVNDMYTRSIVLADFAKTQMATFMDSLRNNMSPPDSLSVQWQSLPAPTIAAVPSMPATPPIVFTQPGGRPGALDADMDDAVIDDFDVAAPMLPNRVAPEVHFGTVPLLPDVRDVAVPDAPVVTLPASPQFLSLTTHTFGGVNLHEDWLDKLDDIPALSILAPTKLQYTPGGQYSSQLLTNLQAVLTQRLNGGSGLNPVVAQQIWDRGRDRETKIAQAREDEVARGAEALGFPLPSGVLAGQLADARRDYFTTLSTLSREVSVEEANLEQKNLSEAITLATQLESQLMDYSFKIESLVFEAAKALAENEVAVFNAQIEQFKSLLAGYEAYAKAYDTLVKAELTKVEVFKALLSAEQVKADINTSLVNQYKAEIEGRMATVEIFKAQVSAAQTLVELERTRIQTAGEQIRAFVATNNAEMSKVELFKAQLGADGLAVENYRTQAQAYSAKAGAQAERARVSVAKYQARVAAKELEWSGYKALIGAESARVEAVSRQSAVLVDGYKIGVTANQAQAELYARMWEGKIKEYEAIQNVTLTTAKINRDTLQANQATKLDAAKVGAQIGSQQLSSAFNAVSTSATISGNASLTQVVTT